MKKLPFYITVGVAVAAIAALIIILLERKAKVFAPSMGADAIPLDENSEAYKTFSGFNFNLYLNQNTPNANAEITALQYLINGYYGDNRLPITGLYDANTAQEVLDITGKSGVSLYEFRYYYFVQVRGDNAAVEIFKQLTAK